MNRQTTETAPWIGAHSSTRASETRSNRLTRIGKPQILTPCAEATLQMSNRAEQAPRSSSR